MKKKLRGIKRQKIHLDFNLYRVDVPIHGVAHSNLSVIDLWPEAVDRTILFVHGYAGCAETWEFQINRFARDYRVVVPDLRGHGQSDAPYTQYTMAEMVDDLHNVIQTLNLPEKFILVGHSFGGSICVEYANAYPERLEKLVLIATPGEYPLPRAAIWVARLPTAFFRLWWKYRPRWNAEIHVMKRLLQNTMRRWKGWHLLRNITTETLIITGEKDDYFPQRSYLEAAQMVPGAEVIDVGAAKHKVQLERRDAVNRALERFIDADRMKDSWRTQGSTGRLLQERPWLKNYGEEVPFTIPLPRQPLHRFLESAADWVPRKTALVFYGKKMSYQQLNIQANRFAHALQGLKIKPGDRVMIVLPNSPQFVIAYYATLKAGGVAVLPNPDAKAEGIIREIKMAQPKVIITLREYAALAREIGGDQLIDGATLIFADIQEMVPDQLSKRLTPIAEMDKAFMRDIGYSMERLLEEAEAVENAPKVDVSPQDLGVIIFTSGTSDEPKGVCLTHANLVANALQTRHWVPNLQYGKETFLSVLPLSHSYGMTSAMNVPITIGARIVLLPVFELSQVLNHIRKYRPTIFPGVPSIYNAINQVPNVRSYGLASIKACISGAAPLPIEVQEEFEKVTQGRLVEGYGLTECSPVTHANPLFGMRKVGSIGVPIPNTDARVVDLTTGEDLPPGHVGELAIRGPQVMQSYLESPYDEGESESVIKDGWLYTGDVAIMDESGYFKIISRKRDTIMAGDYSVYPRDVEEVLYENSKVLEVAVVGVGTAEEGQKVKAFVVPVPGTKLSKDELIALCRRRLEPYEVPWDIEFRETLPKSFVGKVLRRMLVED